MSSSFRPVVVIIIVVTILIGVFFVIRGCSVTPVPPSPFPPGPVPDPTPGPSPQPIPPAPPVPPIPPLPPTPDPEPVDIEFRSGTVIKVIDATHLLVKFDFDRVVDVFFRKKQVRLIGIIADDVKTPEGERAKRVCEELCLNKTVKIQSKENRIAGLFNLDADVYVDGKNLAQLLLEQGVVRKQ